MTLTCFIPGSGWAGILTPLSLFCQPPLPLVIQSRYQTAFSHRQKLYIQTKLEETRCDSPIIATQNVHLPLAKCCIFLRFSSGRLSLITSQMGHPLPPGTTHPLRAPRPRHPVAPRPNSGLRGHKGWELLCQLSAITRLFFKIRIYYRCIC